jgi:sporulation protein YlmC with PRC-barrel domain
MMRSMQDLERYAIGATDGPIGQVKDFYFDDEAWVIRYLVVETGSWLSSRKVLISPMSIRQPDWDGKLLPVSITMAQVANSPEVDTDKPVSRQHEIEYLGYYGYPYYWGGEGLWGEGMAPYGLLPPDLGSGAGKADRRRDEEAAARAEREHERNDDPHLRSCQAVVGYHIHASDGEIGHVSDLLVDEANWAIRYMVVDTSNWWLGHKVLIAPPWISGVHWSDQSVSVALTRESVQNAPTYDSTAELNRQREESLYAHYGRSGYWNGRKPFDSEL